MSAALHSCLIVLGGGAARSAIHAKPSALSAATSYACCAVARCAIAAARAPSTAGKGGLRFFLGCGPMGNSKGNVDHTGRSGYFPCAVVQRVAAAINASSSTCSGARAHVLDFSGLMDDDDPSLYPGCVGGCRHPSELAHAKMAQRTAEQLRSVLGWDGDS